MDSNQSNELTVSFPADVAFTRIGRVSVAGLALRLAIDISRVEELRKAADLAVQRLQGSGRITVKAQWSDHDLIVRIENPNTTITDETDIETEIGCPDEDFNGDSPKLQATTIEQIVEPPSRIFLRLNIDPPTKTADTTNQPED